MWNDNVNLTIPEIAVLARAVDTRPSSLLPHGLGTRLAVV